MRTWQSRSVLVAVVAWLSLFAFGRAKRPSAGAAVGGNGAGWRMRRGHWLAAGLLTGLLLVAGFGFAQRSEPAGKGGATTFGGQSVRADDGKLGIIAFGAHPDDCELFAGGCAAMWAKRGDHVKFVSVTNGDVGHWSQSGGALAKRRNAEVQAAAKILGITSQVLDIHDGELMPTLENRKRLIRLIRRWNADIVISHRPADYHPDHRYTGVLVQDCAYMVGVPFLCPDTPHLKRTPVFLYSYDRFQRPNPFRADIVVAIDSVIDQKLNAVARMESQFIEGGCMGNARRVPRNDAERKAAHAKLRDRMKRRFAGIANQFRRELIERYGEEKGKQIRYAEAFEICEYGRRPTKDKLRQLFPSLSKP